MWNPILLLNCMFAHTGNYNILVGGGDGTIAYVNSSSLKTVAGKRSQVSPFKTLYLFCSFVLIYIHYACFVHLFLYITTTFANIILTGYGRCFFYFIASQR